MSKMTLDFSGVEDKEFGDYITEPGTYVVKVTSVEKVTPEDSMKYPYLKWGLEVVSSGSQEGNTVNHNTSLKPESLFSLRNFLIALGLKVPNSSVSLDMDKLKGKTCSVEVNMRPYNDKLYANVKKVMAAPTKVAKTTTTVELGDDMDELGDL